MAFERTKELVKRFRAPTNEEKITSLQQQTDALSTRRDKIYADASALEQRETKLLEEGKASESKLARRRMASQLLQVRRYLQRQHTTAAMINGQVDILNTDIHNRTLLQQGAIANLSDTQKITENAVRAEEILESVSSDASLMSVFEPGIDLVSQEELDILAEFDAVEPEPEEGPDSREDGCIGYPEATSTMTREVEAQDDPA